MRTLKKTAKLLLVTLLVMTFILSLPACDREVKTTPQYTVTFITYIGDSSVAAQTVEENGCAVKPAAPARDGYEFINWYPTSACEGEPYDFSNPVKANITLYAKWQANSVTDAKVTVTLDYNYDGAQNKQITLNKGETLSGYELPERTGYKFEGWYLNDGLFSLDTAIDRDITLVAKWSKDAQTVVKYTVTFVTNCDTAMPAVEVEAGTAYTAPNPAPRENYLFGGWFTDEELSQSFTNGTAITRDTALYAKWIENSSGGDETSYTVTFDSKGGSAVSAQTVTANDVAVKPSDPEYAGMMLTGWYRDENYLNLYDFSAPVTQNLTLYAKWEVLPSGIVSANGYNESLTIKWRDGAPSNAEVYYRESSSNGSWVAIESELIRATDESGVARADIVGLSAGSYDIKIKSGANEELTLPSPITVEAYDRSGYAHFRYTDGVGAYKDDGTVKNSGKGTLVIYVTEENKNTVDYGYVNGVKVDLTQYLWNGKTGIGWILNNRAYGSDAERANYGIQKLCFTYDAVAVRIIGKVNAEDASDATISLIDGLTAYNSTGNGGSTNDNGRMARITNAKNLTIEGIGDDAMIYGWGIHFISSDAYGNYSGSGKSFEVRNITFKNYPEDAIGMEGQQGTGPSATDGANATTNYLVSPVERCWIHNNVFYPGYCASPAESDKGEGDGSCDFKRGQYYTLSYNYFEYCHKTNLIGSSDASLTYNITMHHNWWNNCGSRMPLARRANIHFYNNYISGDSTDSQAALSYVTALRANCLVFSEANYFDGSKNVTQLKDGVGVAWNNMYYACTGENAYIELTSRTQTVANSCAYIKAGIDYSQFYIDSSLFYYDSTNGASDCLLDTAVQARQKAMMYAGVIGFGTTETAMNTYTPSSAVNVADTGETVITLPASKTDSEYNGVLFRGLTGASSGTIKGKGQIVTFTLAAEAQLTVTVSASAPDYLPELVSADGTVWANKFSGTLTVVLPAGTYFIGTGDKAKEVTVSYMSFADTATSSEARIAAAKAAIDALPETVSLNDGELISAAQLAYNALTSSEKNNFDTEYYNRLAVAVSAYDSLRVTHVINLIDAIGTVTENSYDAINAAQTAYDSLSSDLQAQVTNRSALNAAQSEFAGYAITNVINMITALDDVSGWTVDGASAKSAEEIAAARAAYDGVKAAYDKLDDSADNGSSQQQQVTNLSKLTEGIAKLDALQTRLDEITAENEAYADFTAAIADADASNLSVGECTAIINLYNSMSAEKRAQYADDITYKAVLERYAWWYNQTITCSFDGSASNPDWTVSGNYYTGTMTINGTTYSKGLKMESSTNVSFSTGATTTLTLYFHSSCAGKTVKVDGVNYTTQSTNGVVYITVENLEAGTHTITKNSTNTYLYLAVLTPAD